MSRVNTLELNNIKIKIKKIHEKDSATDFQKDKINKLENQSIQIIQSEQQKEKKQKRNSV